MIELNVLQGSPEWHAARASNDCASEAAAALGLSKQCTRSELMKIKHTGLTPDVSEWTQKFLFDKGHEIEALARPIVEKRIGKELFPLTGLSDDKRFLASLDGMEIEDDMVTLGDLLWENKMLNPALRDYIVENNDLPDTHWPQCEQQLLVTGAKQVYFTVSDGTEEGTTGIFYESKPERRQRLISGWAQFNEDLFSYELPEIKPAAVAEAIEDLPALTVQLVGQVTASNLADFKMAVTARIQAINTTLVTDNDFATADKMVKFLDDGEKRLDLVKSQALAQTESIDALFRTIDSLKAEMCSKRLTLDKLVLQRKDAIKTDAVQSAKAKLSDHVSKLNERIGLVCMPQIVGDFAGAAKNKRSIASLGDAVDTELSRCKILSNEVADKISINLAWFTDYAKGFEFLFPDLSTIVSMD